MTLVFTIFNFILTWNYQTIFHILNFTYSKFYSFHQNTHKKITKNCQHKKYFLKHEDIWNLINCILSKPRSSSKYFNFFSLWILKLLALLASVPSESDLSHDFIPQVAQTTQYYADSIPIPIWLLWCKTLPKLILAD